jgi:hypothetical protein
MIYVSPSIVLSPALLAPLRNPSFLWRNAITSVVADHEDIDYPAVNLLAPQTYSMWKSDTLGQQSLVASISSETAINAIGIAKHNFAGHVLTIRGITADDGAEWQTLAEMSPGDERAILAVFEPGYYEELEIEIDGEVMPEAAVLYAGTLLVVPRGVPQSHMLAKDALQRDTLVGVAENGDFLGDVITSERFGFQVDLTALDGDWYRQNMRPFVQSGRPFFYAQSPALMSGEAVFGKLEQVPQGKVSYWGGQMDVSLQIVGLAV